MSTIDVMDPRLSRILYSIQDASDQDIDEAVSRAREGAEKLRQTRVRDRLIEVERLIQYLLDNQSRLLERIVEESGRSIGDAMLSDLLQLVEDCHWLVQNAERILADQKIPTPLTLLGKKSRIYHEAHGVVLVISPWNLPLAIATSAAMFAFAAGNAVIIKPSEQTPMQEIFDEIVNLSPMLKESLIIVQGGGHTAERLIEKRRDLIHFTGSVATGRKVLAQAASKVIPVCAELGAKDAMIVFADAALERAVAAACWGNMHNSGQSCTATERLFVHETIYEDFVAMLAEAFDQITVGVGADSDLGGLTTAGQMKIVEDQVKDAVEKGATVVCGGERIEQNFFKPTVLTGLTDDMKVVTEETFGPVVAVFKFSTEEEVIQKHNHCDFGLSSSVWTSDKIRADRVARALVTGCVNINNIMLTEGNAGLPFGGVRQSGYGRTKGAEGLLNMTRSKAVLIETQGKQLPEPNWYPYSRKKLHLMEQLIKTTTRTGSLKKYVDLAMIGMKLERLVRQIAKKNSGKDV
ncbi:MAG: aldehyde dehydrogenase family protein [Endozoicomonas sp.]|uniref:aldehyde dehydrogenase family protein n=1 Tax=Endozoicomonas sp. TaxID=1892382 RepID=UPI003D9AF0B9